MLLGKVAPQRCDTITQQRDNRSVCRHGIYHCLSIYRRKYDTVLHKQHAHR
jgi:hypothetical protein